MHLFVYGTLIASEIFEALTGRIPVYLNASLKHYKRVHLNNCNFPGLVPSSNYMQKGYLIELISDHEMEIIEDYEGEMYEKTVVQVNSNQQLILAYTFVLKSAFIYLVQPLDWNYSIFRKKELSNYLNKL